MAERSGQGPVTLEAICSQRAISRQYLAKIFSALGKAGLVRAVRGKLGGYVLARAPENVTLLEVIEAVEGPITLNLCQHDPPKCDRIGCALRPVWGAIQEDIRSRLGALSLAECLAREPVLHDQSTLWTLPAIPEKPPPGQITGPAAGS